MPNEKDKMLTIEDLVCYFSKNKIKSFSYSESGKPIVVKAIQDFAESDVEMADDGKMYCKVRVCHILKNRNGSYISKENMEKAMPTLKYSPLLANIHQLDNGEWDFHSHDMHMDEDGNSVYDERQIGAFTVDEPYFEYDENMDKTYVVARVAIPTEYTRAAEIIKSKGGTKVSCELAIYSCSFNAKEKYLELDDFIFMGCTCLGREKDGTEIGEGMLGSKLTLEDFSANDEILTKIIELQERLSKIESSCFNIQSFEKGGIAEVENEEMLTNEVTAEEEVTEDVVATEEEEVVTTDEDTTVETPEEDGEVNVEVVETEACGDGKKAKKKNELRIISENKEFSVSLQDKIYALNDLVNAVYGEADNTYYCVTAYEDYVVMCDWWSGNIYKQSYSDNEGVYTLIGDRIQVYAEYVTKEELDSLNEMRSNYELMAEKLNKYEVEPQKMSILESDEYKYVANADEFEELLKMENHFDLSIEDVKKKADELLLKYIKAGSFSLSEVNESVSKKTFATTNKNKTGRYGGLFSK